MTDQEIRAYDSKTARLGVCVGGIIIILLIVCIGVPYIQDSNIKLELAKRGVVNQKVEAYEEWRQVK